MFSYLRINGLFHNPLRYSLPFSFFFFFTPLALSLTLFDFLTCGVKDYLSECVIILLSLL